jgi:hypothetical protein
MATEALIETAPEIAAIKAQAAVQETRERLTQNPAR